MSYYTSFVVNSLIIGTFLALPKFGHTIECYSCYFTKAIEYPYDSDQENDYSCVHLHHDLERKANKSVDPFWNKTCTGDDIYCGAVVIYRSKVFTSIERGCANQLSANRSHLCFERGYGVANKKCIHVCETDFCNDWDSAEFFQGTITQRDWIGTHGIWLLGVPVALAIVTLLISLNTSNAGNSETL